MLPFRSFAACPECRSVYHMKRGGCIHFLCKECNSDFCGFCSKIFYSHKRPCTECEPVKQNSLHAHHPRNCFYYLRDESLDWLIDLLQVTNYASMLSSLNSRFLSDPELSCRKVHVHGYCNDEFYCSPMTSTCFC